MSELEKALRSQRQSWLEIVNRILKESYSESLPWKKGIRRVLLFGVGSSLSSSKLAAYTVIRGAASRMQIFALPSQSMGVELIPESGDVAIGLSHRGQTLTTLKALDFCRQRGAFTVLVTANGASSPFSPDLQVSTSELEKCEPHTMGMTGAVCAVTTLLLGNPVAEVWRSYSKMPDPDLSSCQSRAGEGPALLLGEWEGEWVAREISLKLMEIAGIRTSVYGSEEYFHGPAASLARFGKKDPIWYVAGSADPKRFQIQAQFKTEFQTERPLGWVHSLVELQWMALAVALNRGMNPDGQ